MNSLQRPKPIANRPRSTSTQGYTQLHRCIADESYIHRQAWNLIVVGKCMKYLNEISPWKLECEILEMLNRVDTGSGL